ncbi:EAL domain-containing protein [Pseudomonas sp. JS3066]|uniref:EAL domain-containing protein n=1 Tax=unclassified Pseudomonas TaxID=196821 RepID=UPI002E7B5AB8|nr:EAL domain-containing protein [Pseudomonas sp. JS3066]WVK91625.1 EAL domain-containing protein [Pseudomonas sp. JS3066]
MVTPPRRRFIWMVTTCYGLLALTWIALSDRLLFTLTEGQIQSWLSVGKGAFFVLSTSFLLYFALNTVPPAQSGNAPTVTVSAGQRRYPRWLTYLFAGALSLAMLAAREHLASAFGERSLLILFMLPIVMSALIGGLGAGLLATGLSAFGIGNLTMEPSHSFYINLPDDQVQLGALVLNGLIVSLLAESLQRSLRKANLQRRLLDSVVSGTSDAVFVKDRRGRYLLVNHAAARYVGKPPAAIVGHDDFELFPADSAHEIVSKDKEVMAAGTTVTHEEHLVTEDGKALDFLVTKGPMLDANGQGVGLFGISRDITERKRIERDLAEAAVVFESSHQGIMMVSPRKSITKVNPAFSRITGYALDEVLGKSPKVLSSGVHGPEFYRKMWGNLDHDGFWRGEIWNRRKNGEIYAEILSISVARNESGGVQHYIGVFTDISQIKAHEAELDRIAHYDPLTGLPNRRLLTDRLQQAVMRAARSNKTLAVCFMDLDGFKAINDDYGPINGDALLIGIAENLRQVLRGDDTLARLGGDEFALLLSDIASPEECALALDRMLAAASKEVDVGGKRLSVSASIGVSLYPNDQADPDTLLRHADQAMYLAKQAGKNRYHLFDPESDRKAQKRRTQLEHLRAALDGNQFRLYYQPQVDLQNGQLLGVEALLRWHDPLQGMRSPSEFLPSVHGSDLERPIGEWVIREAVAQAARWYDMHLDISVSINVSASQLLHPGFHELMRQTLANHATLPPGHIELEILESAAIADMDQAIDVLRLCRSLGVRFAIDDFGTGYSSLTYLRKLPVQILKIDQSFIRNMLIDPEDLGIVEGVIQLANTFKLDVIAEGVETREHARQLRRMGCHLAQGYGIARPMPADQLAIWATHWQHTDEWLSLESALKLSS